MTTSGLSASHEAALARWARAATRLGAGAVIWAPLADKSGRALPKPARPYLTLQVTTPPHDAYGSASRDAVAITGEDTSRILFLDEVVARVNAPPGAPAIGAVYLVGDAPTDAWAGHAGELAAWTAADPDIWVFAAPAGGDRVAVVAGGMLLRFDGAAWQSEPDMALERRVSHQAFTLTVNAYAKSDAADAGARAIISACVTALGSDRVIDSLSSTGLGVSQAVSVRNLSALVDVDWESRAAADIVFHVAVVQYAAVDVIERFAGTGTGA